MTDELERRLRRDLPATALPQAPDSLRDRLRAVAATDPQALDSGARSDRARGSRARLFLGIAAVLLLGGAATLSLVGSRGPDFPTTVDGLTVMTVSDALTAHAAGDLAGGRVAVKGWWSDGSIGHSCAPPALGESPGDLEIYCHDGEYGITELDETILAIDLRTGQTTYTATGPRLSPYFDSGLARSEELFGLPIINDQRYPPVPILVIGHFDDPRAAQCRPQARQLCLDRLVLELIVQFDPATVPTPGVTPSPTPFQPPPTGPFEAAQCAGDVPYSFVGWTATSELHMQFERPGQVFAMVTEEPVVLTESDDGTGWVEQPGGSLLYQLWGRKVCIATEPFSMEFGWVVGSTYVQFKDGSRVPGENPVHP